jgi:putative N6-adenine-specific DNA methylase
VTDHPVSLFAITAPGLEPIVARELAALGEKPTVEEGGVSWEGDATSMMRANLWLRAATRVIVRVARFRATAFHELERSAKRVPWERFVGAGQPVGFRVTTRKSKLYHSDAIAERLARAASSGSGSASESEQVQMFVVRVVRDAFEISADSSGVKLHMRGYRQAVGKAPLRETLAAALLLAADWDGSSPLLDPMCGSGTIPIEGALLARRIAPGARRDFAFTRWPAFHAPAWTSLLDSARTQELPSAPHPIVASDRDAGAVESAIANATRAGVAGDIAFRQAPVSAARPSGAAGLIATNPPYGVRVGATGDVRNLYAQLGNTLREHFAGWMLALYAANPALASQLAIPLNTAFRSTNGGLKVAALLGILP